LRNGRLALLQEPAHGKDNDHAKQQQHHHVGHAFAHAQMREQRGEADTGGQASQRAHPAAHAGLGRRCRRCGGGVCGCRRGGRGSRFGGDGVALHYGGIAADAAAFTATQALGGLGVLDHQAGTHDDGKQGNCDAFHCGSPLLETCGAYIFVCCDGYFGTDFCASSMACCASAGM
jgi:hypothetical protein